MINELDDLTFTERIEIIIKLAGSAEKLAQKTGISSRMIGKYLSGDSDPTRRKLVAMADAVDVNVKWLATGEGELARSSIPDDVIMDDKSDVNLYGSISDAIREFGGGISGKLDEEDNEIVFVLHKMFRGRKNPGKHVFVSCFAVLYEIGVLLQKERIKKRSVDFQRILKWVAHQSKRKVVMLEAEKQS